MLRTLTLEETREARTLLLQNQQEIKALREDDGNLTTFEVLILALLRRQNLVLIQIVGRDLP